MLPITPVPDAATAAGRHILLRLAGPIFSIVSLVVSLVLIEAALARYLPFPDPFARYKIEDRGARYVPSAHARNYSMRVIAEPDLPGVTGTSTFSTNNVGFRGEPLLVPKPANEYRIVLVGGSTAECFVLDEGQALHMVLQRRLRERVTDGRIVRVYNAGKAGDKSYDHVALLAHRIVHLQPDLVVVFAGFNDQRAAMLDADYLHLRDSIAVTYTLPMLLKFAATEFQIPRRVHAEIHRLSTPSERERLEQVQLVTDYREKAVIQHSHPVSTREPRTDVGPYERNLRTIAALAGGHGFATAFMTHATTWNSTVDPKAAAWHWLRYVDGVHYREDVMERALEAYNDVSRRLAADTRAPLLDLARVLPKSLEFFYDDVHFNAKGAARAGELLGDLLAGTVFQPAAASTVSRHTGRSKAALQTDWQSVVKVRRAPRPVMRPDRKARRPSISGHM